MVTKKPVAVTATGFFYVFLLKSFFWITRDICCRNAPCLRTSLHPLHASLFLCRRMILRKKHLSQISSFSNCLKVFLSFQAEHQTLLGICSLRSQGTHPRRLCKHHILYISFSSLKRLSPAKCPFLSFTVLRPFISTKTTP